MNKKEMKHREGYGKASPAYANCGNPETGTAKRSRTREKPPHYSTVQGMVNKYLWAFILMLTPAFLFAQAVPYALPATVGLTGGRFFAALVSGIIFALAFQLVLTNLSAAAGLSVLGSATSPKNLNKNKGRGEEGRSEGSSGVQGTVRKISGAFGIWALITASISLFFASWFAAALGAAIGTAMGALIGLTIWGLFYLTTMTIEATAATSMVGALAGIVKNSFKATSNAVSSVFGKSPESQAADSVARITAAVREEIFGSRSDMRKQLQSYIDQLKPQLTPEQMGKEISSVLSDTEIHSIQRENRENVISFLVKSGLNKENAQRVAGGIKSIAGTAKEEAQSGKGKVEQAADTAARVAAGVSGGEAQAYREKVENYLRQTGKKELSPDGIKRDIAKLFSSPKEGMESLKNRAQGIDKESLVSLLSQRKDMSPDEARKVVDNVDRVLSEIGGKAQQGKGQAQGMAEGVQAKIKDYLDSLGRPELRYEGIKNDLVTLFHDPKAGGDALINRMKSIDRDSVKAILSSRRDISDQQAEQIIDRVEAARDEIVNRAEQMRSEIERRVDQVKYEAMREADETRKTAATAAWWLFGTAVVSAIAAVLGGMAGAA